MRNLNLNRRRSLMEQRNERLKRRARLERLNEGNDLLYDPDELYNKYVFKDYKEFERKCKEGENGVSDDFLEEYYQGDIEAWYENNIKSDNFNCWNCFKCKSCKSCKDCTNCEDCSLCTSCNNCFKCVNCENCIGCEKCSYCYRCEDCVETNSCEDCEDCNECYECYECVDCSVCEKCVECEKCKKCKSSAGLTRHKEENKRFEKVKTYKEKAAEIEKETEEKEKDSKWKYKWDFGDIDAVIDDYVKRNYKPIY